MLEDSAHAPAAIPPPTTAAAGHDRPLTAREKATYAAGDVAEGGLNFALATFLLFYLTAVCGLPGSLAGLALFLSLMVDSVLDPIIGYMSDHTRSRWGRRHPFLIGASAPLALGLALIFNLPPLSGGALFGFVLGLLLVKRALQSMFFLSYGAMGAELWGD
jgi:GPH family glycoside/pentoside/hexuronide:cation symporter